jgi:TRAP-type mannitol/chloroaromatic compound transport system permease large subunit
MRALAPPEISLIDIYRSVAPFFALMVISVVIIMIFPQIALWLPNVYTGR